MPDELEYIRSTWKTKRALGKPKALEITGADFQTRTGDPILTMAPKLQNHRSELPQSQTYIFKTEAVIDRKNAALATGVMRRREPSRGAKSQKKVVDMWLMDFSIGLNSKLGTEEINLWIEKNLHRKL